MILPPLLPTARKCQHSGLNPASLTFSLFHLPAAVTKTQATVASIKHQFLFLAVTKASGPRSPAGWGRAQCLAACSASLPCHCIAPILGSSLCCSLHLCTTPCHQNLAFPPFRDVVQKVPMSPLLHPHCDLTFCQQECAFLVWVSPG